MKFEDYNMNQAQKPKMSTLFNSKFVAPIVDIKSRITYGCPKEAAKMMNSNKIVFHEFNKTIENNRK